MNKAEKKAPRQHAESFKRDAVRRMSNREGKTVVQLAKDLGVTPSQLYEWQNKYAEVAQEPTEAMQAELVRLRKENQQLREERDVLKKAVASSTSQRNTAASVLAGVVNPRVFRGRSLSWRATAFFRAV